MTTANREEPAAPVRRRRIGPVLALVVLAPVVAEVLPGFTRVTAIPFAILPELGIWGCGAVLIRELTRRRGLGWASMVVLGIALAVAEEFVIQQTSLAPLAGLAVWEYGRAGGVNLVYALWALGYESVWVVVLPVLLVELLYPDRREQPWLTGRGIAVASAVFIVASTAAWFQWTQYARVQIFHLPPYQAPPQAIAAAVGGIGLLAVLALSLPAARRLGPRLPLPGPWALGLAVLVLSLPWFLLVTLALLAWPVAATPPWLALAAGAVWAGAVLLPALAWTGAPGWRDAHRLALIAGAVGAAMVGGWALFLVGGASPVDGAGMLLLDLLAVLWIVRFARAGCPPRSEGEGTPISGSRPDRSAPRPRAGPRAPSP